MAEATRQLLGTEVFVPKIVRPDRRERALVRFGFDGAAIQSRVAIGTIEGGSDGRAARERPRRAPRIAREFREENRRHENSPGHE